MVAQNAVELFANYPSTTVSSGGTTAPAAGTSESWTVASSASFPAASNAATPPTVFYVADLALPGEVMLVTNVSGTTWTVTRGADGTTPAAHSAGFTVRQVLAGVSYRELQTPNWLNVVAQYGADPTGGADSTSAIQAALLAYGTLGSWSQGQGGVVYLPPGIYKISKTLIVPSGVTLRGAGRRSSQVSLITGSNCDCVQFATYNSSSQASVLSVSAASITNAFYAAIERLAIHGDSFGTHVAGYCHGINATTNPLTSTAPADPDFDPCNTVRDVDIKACTGDGWFAAGRGGTLLERVISEYNNGNGFSPGFDTTMVDCLANANNICGFYLNHGSNCGTGCKSYLSANGSLGTWTSGGTYAAGNVVLYSGVLYFCIVSISGGTTAPPSDAAHWTAVSATSPAAWGCGWYFDGVATEHNWAACDGQQNLTADYYFNTCAGIAVMGSTNQVNYPNGSNPGTYASVVFNGATGNTAIVNSSSQNYLAALCNMIGSNSGNTLIAVTDGTGGTAFPNGTPAYAMVNGTVQSSLTAAQAVTAGVVVLTFSASMTINAASGNTFRVTLTASTGVFNAPTNATDGQEITLELIQDGTGSRTISSWNSAFDFGAAGTPTLTTTASKRDLVAFRYSASLAKWMSCWVAKGF